MPKTDNEKFALISATFELVYSEDSTDADVVHRHSEKIVEPPPSLLIWVDRPTVYREYFYRVKLALHLGYLPKECDHVNGDRRDNRLVNLREANRIGNNRNRRTPKKKNASLPKGVAKHKGRNGTVAYAAWGRDDDGRFKNLGYFPISKHEGRKSLAKRRAGEAADVYRRQLYGPFHREKKAKEDE